MPGSYIYIFKKKQDEETSTLFGHNSFFYDNRK